MENKVFRNQEPGTRSEDNPLCVIARYKTIVLTKKVQIIVTFLSFLFAFSACNFNTIIDTNQSLEDNQWLYANATKANFEIKDITKPYQVNFKLRINTEYRYSNLYVLATLKNAKSRKKTRYQFKLAKEDGQWLGKGSGDLYTYSFPLLRNHRFADTGKYSIEIEQNMRDNPLLGISDIGIEVR